MHHLQSSPRARIRVRVFTLVVAATIGTTGSLVSRVAAATAETKTEIAPFKVKNDAGALKTFGPSETKTEMAPFKVEAEFGLDGLRIQNSEAVLNQHMLDRSGVARLQDVSGIAPNLFTSNSDSRGFGDVLALRGLANSLFFSPPAIALYVDGVPAGSVASYPSSLLQVESLTVKAGPQGTDYGRNAAGGVIDLRSREPGAQHRGKLQADYGSYEAMGVQAAFDGPLNPQLGYSASFGYDEREGYIDNTFRRRTADDRRAFAGRGALTWRPDDKTQLRFGALVETIDDDAARLSSLFSPDRFQVASDLNGETDIDRSQFSFQARRSFAWGSLVATTSRQDWEVDPAVTDLDLSPLPLASSRVLQSEELWTQEVRFESLPGANRTLWRAGVFYSDSEIDGDATRAFVVPPSMFVPPGFVQTERTVFDLGQTSLAGYANLDHPLTAQTTLKLGLRLEHAESDIKRTKASSNNLGFPTPQDPRLSRSQYDDYLSATAGVVHAVSDSLNFQARTSLARKPEGYSGFTANPQLARFDDERIWSSEAGLTFGPPQGRFGGSVLGFWNRIRGYQFERTVPNSTDFVVVNARDVTTRGVEAKFMFHPVERVWWDFQAGYTDARFDDHRDATGARLDDRRVPFIPRFTASTGVTVDFGRGFSGNASYAAIGRTFYDERNTAQFSQKAYGIVSAQLRYRYDRWAVTLYGHNFADEEYYQFINPEIFAGSPGAPRRFGVRVSFEY